MQHAVEQSVAVHAIESVPQQQPSAMSAEVNSQSSTSSPKSQKTSLEPNASQVSESTLQSATVHELTPPSSVASTQEQHDVDRQAVEDPGLKELLTPQTAIGKKRTANGQIKEAPQQEVASKLVNGLGHTRNISTTSQGSNARVGELSQQLRTKLTYAMIKVQNGWQKHSLDEIESIASQSPRSNISGIAPRDHQSVVSPRSVLASGMQRNVNLSQSSDHHLRQQVFQSPAVISEYHVTPPRKSLAPSAPIVPGNRRRPAPNGNLQINSSLKPPPRPIRPTTAQRTPSQNAAMEADAVETLLFMSASPNNSGHFPSHLSTYSPTSQAFSTQTSPLKSQFSPNDKVYPMSASAFSPRFSHRRPRFEDKAALIDRLLHDLDDDESEELDRAVKIMEQHQAAKLSA